MARIKGSKKTGGRKKGVKNKKTVAEKIRKGQELEFIQKEIRKQISPIIKAMVEKCKTGDMPAIKEALERLVGKTKEEVKIEGNLKHYNWGAYGNNNNLSTEKMDKGTSRE